MAFFDLPKFGKLAGKVFNRSDFIKGRAKTYFAPGQSPNVVNTYKAPTAWRPAGSLLTPPQVVWLTLAPIIGPYGLTFINGIYAVWSDVTYSPPAPWTDNTTVTLSRKVYFADGTITTDNVTFLTGTHSGVQTITNVTAFPATQSRYSFPLYSSGFVAPDDSTNIDQETLLSGAISYIRHDRTDPPVMPDVTQGVEAFDPGWSGSPAQIAWFQSSMSGDTTVYNQTVPDIIANERTRLLTLFQNVVSSIRELRPGKTWVRVNDISIAGFLAGNGIYNIEPCLSFELAPPPKPKFFGVDFLHMHFLGASDGGDFPTNDWPTFTGDAPASRAQLAAAYKQFFRYRCKVYGPDGTFAEFPAAPPISNAFQVPPSATATQLTTPVVDNLTNTTNNPTVKTLNDNRVFTVNTENAFLASLVPGTNNFLRAEIPNVKQYGVRYAGTQSKVTDASFLMGIIAKHFHFDPDTGNDLPLPGSG